MNKRRNVFRKQKCKNEGMYTIVQMAQMLNKEVNKSRTAEVRKYRKARKNIIKIRNYA